MDLNGPTVRPSKLLVSPFDDDHPAFRHFHYVLVWKGGPDYVVMDIAEMKVFREGGVEAWWSDVRGEDARKPYVMTLAKAIRLAESLFSELRVNGLGVQDVLNREEWYEHVTRGPEA